MEFVAAKCPNCSGDLRLPDDKKRVKCMYCGFDIIVQEAIKATGANVENWLKLAAAAEETGNYEEAYKYFTRVLEFEPDNYIAQFGKAINAGYLSTPYKFRSEELTKGVKAAIEIAPDDKKPKFKLQAAEKILRVCDKFRVDSNSDESKIQLSSVISCLEMAHDYAPSNERIITSLHSNYKIHELQLQLFNHVYKIDEFEKDIADYKQKAKDLLSKLETINPEKAVSLRKDDEEIEKNIEGTNKPFKTTSGSGCLVTLMSFFMVALGFLFLLF